MQPLVPCVALVAIQAVRERVCALPLSHGGGVPGVGAAGAGAHVLPGGHLPAGRAVREVGVEDALRVVRRRLLAEPVAVPVPPGLVLLGGAAGQRESGEGERYEGALHAPEHTRSTPYPREDSNLRHPLEERPLQRAFEVVELERSRVKPGA